MNPKNLLFNSNLQEFTQKVSYIYCLETDGRVSPEDSFRQLKSLWKEFKKMLGIGQKLSTDEDKRTGE